MKVYKTELNPNNKQITLLRKSVGTARFAYNWGLERKQTVHLLNQLPIERVKYPTAIDLRKELNELKKTKFPWMYETSKCVPQEALRDLDASFKNFFEGRTNYPKFKSKKSKKTFRVYGAIKLFDKSIQIPRIGKIRLKEIGYVPKDKRVISATISERAKRWFVSVLVEEEVQQKSFIKNKENIIGVDLGINSYIHTSENKVYENIRVYNKFEKKLRQVNKKVSRRVKSSKRWYRAVDELCKLHFRISNIRLDYIHKITTELTRTKSIIVVENLNVKGMKKSNIAKSVSDVAFGMTLRFLEYKGKLYNCKILKADRFYPSSKTCSNCNWYNTNLQKSDRTFTCNICNLKIDRDLNAAINLKKLAASSAESINAHGVGTSGSNELSSGNEVRIERQKRYLGKFQGTGLEVRWYKHLGRSAKANKNVRKDEMFNIFMDCLESIKDIKSVYCGKHLRWSCDND